MALFNEDLTQWMHLWKLHLYSVYKWLPYPLQCLLSATTLCRCFYYSCFTDEKKAQTQGQ